MFVLARHGEAGKKDSWKGPDLKRPLSATGHQQAVGLSENLGMLQSPRLVSSPYLRCRQTLEPLARRRGCSIETDARLSPAGRAPKLDRLLSDDALESSILCLHGETIMEILGRWKRLGLVSLPMKRSEIQKDSTAKGAAWIFIDEGDGWVAHYLQALHVGPVLAES